MRAIKAKLNELRKKAARQVRAWIVLLLDRNPRTCWKSLCMWWLYPERYPFTDIFRKGSGIWWQDCTPTSDRFFGYCGKCGRTGRLWRRR